MAQWEKLQQLDNLHLQRVDELYSHEEFPMDVRHYLAPWIESQDWHKAAQDQSAASILFQSLLENLDTQHSRFVQEGECFLKQRNIRRFKQSFQKYQEQPWILAGIVWWFLTKEQEILEAAQLAEQVQMLQVQQSPVDSDSQRNLQGRITELKRKVQDMEHNFKCLEEQQDEFDFKYKTRSMEGNVSKEESLQQTKILQYLLNRLDTSRKALLNEMSVLLDADEELITVLVRDELAEWQRRQQKACIGAPEDTSLNKLEGWFTMVADCLFHLRKFLRKIDELHGKVTYDHDPFKTQKPVLQRRVDSLLTALLKSSFVVETQPSMPQGKGPMVLRTNVQFSVKTRLLVKFTELNHAMKVTVSIDREAPQVKGYRRFNVLGNSSKFMNMTESASGGMVADFRHLTLKEQKAGGGGKGINELSLSVTEELHVINFETLFELHGLSVKLEASSLPVVIISNSSQQQNAWASVLWFNMLCSDPKNIAFLANSPVATWPQLADLLSWQFLSTTKRGLEDDQLNMIAQKLFGKQQSYDTCTISWARFSKEMVPGFNFTFWAWFDGILVLVKNYLENLWNDGCIMGFVGKGREKTLLKKKQMGTFLLRFSESIKDGGITFSWVEYSVDGTPNVRTVQPFTKGDLSQIPFSEIIRNFQILEAENVPVNPLKFLYPSVPKDEAFGKYYTVKNTAENPYIKYIKTKLVFVSKENTLEAKSPMSTLSDRDVTVPMNGLCTPHSEEAAASSDVLLHSDCLFSDMDDATDLLSPLCTVDLEQSLQEYMNDVNLILSEDQAAAPAPSDLACYSLPCSSSLF